jgi:hypothetical protein
MTEITDLDFVAIALTDVVVASQATAADSAA